MVLTVSDVSKMFKGKTALQNVTFELRPGIYGLLGPNGAGKTSLMKIMADIMRPTDGNIFLNGVPITELGESYRDLLGYMPQELGVYRDFTAEQYLLYMAALKGLSKKEAYHKVYEQLEVVQLEQSAKKRLRTFSGGMIRRIGIAQTLLNSPKVLLLDEPTASLDPQERIRLRNILSDLSGRCIVVLSTHIVSDIELIAEKAILLNSGKLLAFDTVKRLVQNLDGMVWSICLPSQADFQQFSDSYTVGNMIQRDGSIHARIISNQKPHEKAILASPTIEDLYLFYFQKGDKP